MCFTDKKGNRITIQENGLISITPKGESTLFYTLEEIIGHIKRCKDAGKDD